MNLIQACEDFKRELKEYFKLDVDVMPSFGSDGNIIGFIMSKTNEDNEEIIAQFHVDLTKAFETH